MKVIRSNTIGFCFGVANTVNIADECIALSEKEGLPCYSIGNLIHNKELVSHYTRLGMKSINTPSEEEPGIALIRAHGVPDKVKRDYVNAGFRVIDSTCPIVDRGASTLRKAAQNGIKTIIIGIKEHAETIGLEGVEIAEGRRADSILITSLEDAKALADSGKLQKDEEIVVVVQTTFREESFLAIRKYLKEKFRKIRFSNAPCRATTLRTKAAMELAAKSDVMVVIGGKDSENTRNLAVKLKETGKPVYFIENEKDLDENLRKNLSQYQCAGICSGSSTPTAVVRAVEVILEKL